MASTREICQKMLLWLLNIQTKENQAKFQLPHPLSRDAEEEEEEWKEQVGKKSVFSIKPMLTNLTYFAEWGGSRLEMP